jgi:hypothetical protein
MNAQNDRERLGYETPGRQRPPFPPLGCAVASAVAGGLVVLLGLRWLWVFGFTDFRQHLKGLGMFIGIVAVVAGGAAIAIPFLWRSITNDPRQDRSE